MKINDLELYLIAIGQNDSAGPLRSLLIRVSTASGLDGWGESGLHWRSSELSARREALLAILAGRSVYDIEELHTLESLSPAPLRNALEMAMWDLVGRRVRLPLCNLFGGYFRRRVPVSLRLIGRNPTQVAQVARERVDQGFRTQTLLATGDPKVDLAMVSAVREMLGDRIELRLDGMSHYELETACDLCATPEFEGLQFLIDPLNTPDLHRLAALSRQISVPLATWRSIHRPSDVMATVRSGAIRFVGIDLEQVGGIGPARACAAVAQAGGATPLLVGRPSVGIAAAAMLHLAAADAAFSGSNAIASRQLRDTILTERLETVDGMITVPQGPGLGIEVDRAKLEKYQVA
jgi:L-alanine-DL-glutamate epimerase-like enolase superfamily enzyme